MRNRREAPNGPFVTVTKVIGAGLWHAKDELPQDSIFACRRTNDEITSLDLPAQRMHMAKQMAHVNVGVETHQSLITGREPNMITITMRDGEIQVVHTTYPAALVMNTTRFSFYPSPIWRM